MQSMFEINPYLGKQCSFKLNHKAAEFEIYEKEMFINLKKIKRHKDTNLHKGFFQTLPNLNQIDHTQPRCIQIAFEK